MNDRNYHHGNLREALTEAAQDILATGGVEALSLRKVALKAGVSPTALYSHFKDKRALLALLATRGFEQLSAYMETETHKAGSSSDTDAFSLLSLARGYVKFAVENAELFRLMFGQEVGNLRDFPELAEAGSKCYAMMADCVATRVNINNPATSPTVAATAAWSLVHGLATLINDGRVSANSCGVTSNDEMIRQVCQTLFVRAGDRA